MAAYGNPGHLYKIDPDLATIALTVDLGDLCCDLTEGAGLVWALDRSGAVIGMDPESGAVSRTLPVELDLNAHNTWSSPAATCGSPAIPRRCSASTPPVAGPRHSTSVAACRS